MLLSPFASCKPTAQVQILTTTKPFWTLKTFDQDGRAKLVGGDEFYIVYNRAAGGGGAEIKEKDKEEEQQRDPTAVALIHDNGDGSYTLDFVTTPMKPNLATDKLTSSSFAVLGNLTVYFDYTCNIGSLAPPSKKMWKNNGSTSIAHTISTMQQQPPIRLFQNASRPASKKPPL